MQELFCPKCKEKAKTIKVNVIKIKQYSPLAHGYIETDSNEDISDAMCPVCDSILVEREERPKRNNLYLI